MGADRQTDRETGQIFNNCTIDDTIMFPSFRGRTETSVQRLLAAAKLYPIRCK